LFRFFLSGLIEKFGTSVFEKSKIDKKGEKIYGKIDFSTAFFDLLGAVIFGVFMAWALLIINRKFGVEN